MSVFISLAMVAAMTEAPDSKPSDLLKRFNLAIFECQQQEANRLIGDFVTELKPEERSRIADAAVIKCAAFDDVLIDVETLATKGMTRARSAEIRQMINSRAVPAWISVKLRKNAGEFKPDR